MSTAGTNIPTIIKNAGLPPFEGSMVGEEGEDGVEGTEGDKDGVLVGVEGAEGVDGVLLGLEGAIIDGAEGTEGGKDGLFVGTEGTEGDRDGVEGDKDGVLVGVEGAEGVDGVLLGAEGAEGAEGVLVGVEVAEGAVGTGAGEGSKTIGEKVGTEVGMPNGGVPPNGATDIGGGKNVIGGCVNGGVVGMINGVGAEVGLFVGGKGRFAAINSHMNRDKKSVRHIFCLKKKTRRKKMTKCRHA
jgi:hypothetical protein